MSDEKKSRYVLELDAKQFTEAALGAKEHIVSIGESSNLDGLVKGLLNVSGTIAAIGIAVYALKGTFEAVFEAENIKAVNAQFELLTKNAGLSGKALRESLETAADGLVDDTDLLKIANQAILNMGSSASRLGELLEASRKIAAGMGRDTKEVFEDLSRAIEFQSQRMFKSLGINIDVEKAFKKYADTLGVGVGVLSQAEKQAALLDATLDITSKKIGDGVEDVKKATNAWVQFKVALKDIGESIVLLFDKTVGPTLTNVLHRMAEAAKTLKDTIRSAIEEKEYYDKSVADNKAGVPLATKKEAQAEAAPAGPPPDLEKRHEAETKFLQMSASLDQDRLKKKQELAASEADVFRNAADQNTLLEQEAAIKIAQIDQDKLLNFEQKSDLKKQVDDNLKTALIANEEKLASAQIAAADKALIKSVTVSDQMANAARASALKQEKAWKESGGVGGAAFQALSTHAVQAFEEIGEGTKSGADIMKGFFLGAIGDMAMFTGQFMIGSAFKTWPYVDPVLLAEGGALVALGGLLHGMARSGSSSSAGGLSSGGGASAGGSSGSISLDATAQGDSAQANSLAAAEAQKRKSVTIQVMGNYFETEETKRSLMDILRNYQDATDYRFVQIGHT